jgi:hypothetical protein
LAGNVDDDDRTVHGSHPLVLLVEGTLEALSKANLSSAIVGLSRHSEARLVEERRKLEEAGQRVELQKLLYSFEPICQVVREGGYGSRDRDDSLSFFVDLLPEWFERLDSWAVDENLGALHARVSDARSSYDEIAGGVVD